MQPFTKHTGLVAPMDRVNVDTDQMVPKQFLKALTREGFGRILFYDWRYLQPGERPIPILSSTCRATRVPPCFSHAQISAAAPAANTRPGE